MLTEHDRPHRMDDSHDGSHDDEAPVATETPKPFPVLEEPSWLDDEEFEDMEAPRDSAFRGIWIGVAAAALTFALVFAIPHWLGWYDLGRATPRAKRPLTPDSAISTVPAQPSHALARARPGPARRTPPRGARRRASARRRDAAPGRGRAEGFGRPPREQARAPRGEGGGRPARGEARAGR